jgi:hypothetical protein
MAEIKKAQDELYENHVKRKTLRFKGKKTNKYK